MVNQSNHVYFLCLQENCCLYELYNISISNYKTAPQGINPSVLEGQFIQLYLWKTSQISEISAIVMINKNIFIIKLQQFYLYCLLSKNVSFPI